MAPIKRKSLRAKASAAAKPASSSSSSLQPSSSSSASASATPAVDNSPFPSFTSTKRDKRSIKHSLLLSKISKSAGGGNAGVKKRRRPNKKLVTTLDALADALPDSSSSSSSATADQRGAGAATDGEANAKESGAIDVPGAQARILVRDRSLKCRPGALKRKKAVEARERLRFERNLAEMAKGVPGGGGGQQRQQQEESVPDVGMAEAEAGASTAERWRALRAFIGGTMEKR